MSPTSPLRASHRRMYVLKPRARITDHEWDQLQYIQGLLEGLGRTDHASTIAHIIGKLELETFSVEEEDELDES